MDNIVFICVLVYVAISMVVGMVLGRNSKTVRSFFISKENLPLWITVPFLLACYFAGSYTAGNAAGGYTGGISTAFPILMRFPALIICVWLVGMFRRYAANGKLTIAEMFEDRFDTKSREMLGVLNMLLYAAFYSAQPSVIASIISPMVGMDFNTITWIVATIFAVMALAGLTGLAWMNIIHGVFMVFGLVVTAIFAIRDVGGFSGMVAGVDSSYFDISSMGFWNILGYTISMPVVLFAANEIPSSVIGSKSPSVARKTLWIVGLAFIPITLLTNFIGIAAKIALPNLEQPATALYAMAAKLGPFFTLITCLAVVGAVFSSAPPYLFFGASGFTRSLYLRFRPKASDKEQIGITRILCVILAYGCNYLCLQSPAFLNVLFSFIQIQAIAGVVFIAGIIWKRVNGTAAFWAMVVGGACSAVWYFIGSPFGIQPFWLSFVPGVTILVILTLCSKEPVSKGYLSMHGKL